MSQSGETVTYSLEAILTRIEGKIDRIDDRLTKLEVGQAKLIEKVEGMDKRLERLENEQSGLVKDISDLKGAKSLIIPVTVAIIENLG
jgi:predicted nuclease with TOPRIM domain